MAYAESPKTIQNVIIDEWLDRPGVCLSQCHERISYKKAGFPSRCQPSEWGKVFPPNICAYNFSSSYHIYAQNSYPSPPAKPWSRYCNVKIQCVYICVYIHACVYSCRRLLAGSIELYWQCEFKLIQQLFNAYCTRNSFLEISWNKY